MFFVEDFKGGSEFLVLIFGFLVVNAHQHQKPVTVEGAFFWRKKRLLRSNLPRLAPDQLYFWMAGIFFCRDGFFPQRFGDSEGGRRASSSVMRSLDGTERNIKPTLRLLRLISIMGHLRKLRSQEDGRPPAKLE